MSRPKRRRTSTATSNFGVGRREGHDSSAFYSRFPVPEISEDSEVIHPACVDRLWVGDARDMDRHGDIADSSVALVVTSPPYYAGKEYEEAIGEGHIPASYIDYLEMLHDVFAECVRKLEPGGRIAVNVANLGRRPYRSLSADVIDILQNRLKLLLRGEIIWQKARGASGNCAWGSFRKASNPVLRDVTERVVIASKGRFDRAVSRDERAAATLPSENSIGASEFMEATMDIWEIRPESARRVGHPAPFPVELPQRLIELYTYRGDLVLDPFIGSGTTALAALRSGRHFVGFDSDPAYIALARQRLDAELSPQGGHAVTEIAL
ncbi:MAG: site-specific DNA-methyltransferase [bacterium]|nr:site-specific DNA-methyltransferase [bacterium]